VPVKDPSTGVERRLHVIQSSLKAKKNSQMDASQVPNVYEMYRRILDTGREEDIVLFHIKKKHPKGHKRKKIDPVGALGEGVAQLRAPQSSLTDLAAAANLQSRMDSEQDKREGWDDLIVEDEQQEAFRQAEAASILKSIRNLSADLSVQASIDSAVLKADLRVECWAVVERERERERKRGRKWERT